MLPGIEFIGVAGTGKTSVLNSVRVEVSVNIKYQMMRDFVSRKNLESCALWYVKALEAVKIERLRRLACHLALKDKHRKVFLSNSGIDGYISSRFPSLEPFYIKRRNEFLKHLLWLDLAEYYELQPVPVLDEGLAGAVSSNAQAVKAVGSYLLGLVHIDTEPSILREALVGRIEQGNMKGPKDLLSISSHHAVERLRRALCKNRLKAKGFSDGGVPVLSVNYHDSPEEAINKVESFIASLTFSYFDRRTN